MNRSPMGGLFANPEASPMFGTSLMGREDLDGDTDQIFRPRQSTYRRNNNFFDLHDDDVFFREANSSRYLSGG